MDYTTHDLARDLLKLPDRSTNMSLNEVLKESKHYRKTKDIKNKEAILNNLENGSLTLQNINNRISHHRNKGSIKELVKLVVAREVFLWKRKRGYYDI